MSKCKHNEEQKQEAVRLLEIGGLSIKEVSQELGVSDWTVRKWQKDLKPQVNSVQEIRPGTVEWHEYHRLKRELAKERHKVEVLKKAISFLGTE
jgi:transposase-like protein